jgi:hypothetical protein
MKYKKIGISILIIFLSLSQIVFSQTTEGRWEKDLSGSGWSLWLDRAAVWYNDSAYLPPVDISKLPVNAPTCGWENLHNHSISQKKVNVPGTVEQYYWGKIGGAIPDTGGNYVGVSWWSRKFNFDPKLQGKRITLCFQSVNLRAEVFINEKLVGYDVIGNTPFEVDATNAIVFGKENFIDVRITDPVGNFSWDDNILMRWGNNLVPAVHGFGGITGSIIAKATDAVCISDIYVQNQPDPKKVKVFVTLSNYSGEEQSGELSLVLHELKNPEIIVWKKDIPVSLSTNTKTFSFFAKVPKAKLWDLSPYQTLKPAALYDASVKFVSKNKKIEDNQGQRFGFRWFDVGEKDADKRFYLNGKRVFILSAMTRGFWPKNGIFATPEMAKRDMVTMSKLGMNTMYMHRAIGQPAVNEYADSIGMFTYEEPGGYRIMPNKADGIEGPDALSKLWRKEKLRRMIIRDRSLPSSIIYYFKNEATKIPDEDDVQNIKMVHNLDPSRIVNYNSGNSIVGNPQKEAANDPTKLHMLPFNDTLYEYGWWDQHHWFPYSGYVDEMYRNPNFYLRGVINGARSLKPQDSLYRLDKKEIIFWGEEGAFGTMVRLQKIKEELDTIGDTGFREKEHEDWFNYYNKFLDQTGFRKSFPTVDSLTMSLGRNLAYFHGRNIENVRLSNIGDAYNMNGWASASTRTDVVDMYRNPTADPSIISHYTQPLYIAVKIRDKVLPVGTSPIADFFIINEENLHGKYILNITFNDPKGNATFNKKFDVTVTGGEIFGQLLVKDVKLPEINEPGYYEVNARLSSDNDVNKASGFDKIFAVRYENDGKIPTHCAIIENDDVIKSFLQRTQGVTIPAYNIQDGKLDEIIIGNNDFKNMDKNTLQDIMKRVESGTKLIVLENADYIGQEINNVLKDRPAIYSPIVKGDIPGYLPYTGGGIIQWNGSGRLFVGKSPFLKGLPESQGMSWEYQCFYKINDNLGRNGMVSGIKLNHWGTELVVALGNQRKKEILASLGRVKVGKGSVMLSTLNILPNLESQENSSVVAKRLFLNLLKY